jgi:hypothetical protein
MVQSGRTRAFIVPWSACLWFLLNLGSVPLREGYLLVFGFLILRANRRQLLSMYAISSLLLPGDRCDGSGISRAGEEEIVR